MIEVGADIYVKDMYGMTSLMIGAKGGHLQVVKFFIEEGDEEDIYQIDVVCFFPSSISYFIFLICFNLQMI